MGRDSADDLKGHAMLLGTAIVAVAAAVWVYLQSKGIHIANPTSYQPPIDASTEVSAQDPLLTEQHSWPKVTFGTEMSEQEFIARRDTFGGECPVPPGGPHGPYVKQTVKVIRDAALYEKYGRPYNSMDGAYWSDDMYCARCWQRLYG
jgi:hypothetical protein